MNHISEDEVLDYLMTSDFNEGLSPDEFIFLLRKFRNFYRISHGKTENLKVELSGRIRDLEEFRNSKNLEVEKYLFDKIEAEKKVQKMRQILNRKLSWKERFLGKIIFKEDEIK